MVDRKDTYRNPSIPPCHLPVLQRGMSSSSDRSPLIQDSKPSNYSNFAAEESNLDVESSAAEGTCNSAPQYYFGFIPAAYITGNAKPSNEKLVLFTNILILRIQNKLEIIYIQIGQN